MPQENTITIRQPATANLMIDSDDRVKSQYPNPFDFQITKPASIMNGFFTRIGTTEVVLEWCENNLSQARDNNQIYIDVSGTASAYAQSWSLNPAVADGIYTVEEALDAIVAGLNAYAQLEGVFPGISFSVGQYAGETGIDCSGAKWEFTTAQQNNLLLQLDLKDPFVLKEFHALGCPDIRPYRYIDFISPQLTYNQDLKDNATNSYPRDVLCRWYFSFDEAPILDAYGFPILMGYTRFCLRRIYNPPKQIRWSNNQPLGNISFLVVDETGTTLDPDYPSDTDWLMTLQFSEN